MIFTLIRFLYNNFHKTNNSKSKSKSKTKSNVPNYIRHITFIVDINILIILCYSIYYYIHIYNIYKNVNILDTNNLTNYNKYSLALFLSTQIHTGYGLNEFIPDNLDINVYGVITSHLFITRLINIIFTFYIFL
jgi:hypothetical protein